MKRKAVLKGLFGEFVLGFSSKAKMMLFLLGLQGGLISRERVLLGMLRRMRLRRLSSRMVVGVAKKKLRTSAIPVTNGSKSGNNTVKRGWWVRPYHDSLLLSSHGFLQKSRARATSPVRKRQDRLSSAVWPQWSGECRREGFQYTGAC